MFKGWLFSYHDENPRVRGSIPRPGTFKKKGIGDSAYPLFYNLIPLRDLTPALL
jgi:hypothetical protein